MIDAHLHLWDPARLSYPWLAQVPAIAGRHALEEWREVAGDADRAVFVQADCLPEQSVAETDWVAGLGPDSPVAGIVAHAPLEQGEAVRDHLDALMMRPLVRGVRRSVQDEPAGFITSPGHRAGLAAAARANLTIDICARDHQLPELLGVLRALFERQPDARVVLDHLGKPDIKAYGGGVDDAAWRDNLAALAALPGVFAKLSGLTTQDGWDRVRPAVLMPYIDYAIDLFGPSRLMQGSDWPVVNLAGGIGPWRAVFDEAVAPLSPADQDRIRRETASRFYRLDVPPAMPPARDAA